ncbi:MAG TPA: hypothetical protein VFI65_13745 [Streptosporangiaceae bacterium]|nr:hypothetical protein [Streptosporangiaceae bacterium]
MRRMRFAWMPAVVVAGVVFAAACASAATVAPTAVASAAGPVAAGPVAGAGAVHFSGFSQNSDGPDFTVVLSGAVGDYGPAVTVRPNGTVDPEHKSQMSLRLKKGSFRLRIARLDEAIVAVTSRWKRTRTCSFHATVTAPTPVVAGSGTGLYKGIRGSLTMTVTIDEVDVKPCPDGTSRFLSQLIFLVGSGTVSF